MATLHLFESTVIAVDVVEEVKDMGGGGIRDDVGGVQNTAQQHITWLLREMRECI